MLRICVSAAVTANSCGTGVRTFRPAQQGIERRPVRWGPTGSVEPWGSKLRSSCKFRLWAALAVIVVGAVGLTSGVSR